ncbi:MAG: DUF2868 domain-containing protein [Phycisphaerales bacterium]
MPQPASNSAAEPLGGDLLRDGEAGTDPIASIQGGGATIAAEAFADLVASSPAALDAAIEAARRRHAGTWNGMSRDVRAIELMRAGSIVTTVAEADRRVRRAIGTATTIMVMLAAIAGGTAAAAALPAAREAPVNIFLLLGGFLGIQTILLFAWLVAAGLLRGGGPSLGRGVAAIASMLVRLGVRRDSHGAAAAAIPAGAAPIAVLRRRMSRESSFPAARWGIGLASNALWTVFNLAGLATAITLLATRQYEFAWESTILSAEAMQRLTSAIASAPPLLGFPVPDAATIAASRFDPANPQAFSMQSDAVRAMWSGLLLGSIVCYALVPRIALTLLCAWRRRAAFAAMRLDRGDPSISMLLAALRDPRDSASGEVVPLPVAAATRLDGSLAARAEGSAAIVGIELSVPRSGWPPQLGVRVEDLGILASREDRQRTRSRLRSSPTRPSILIVVCDAASTPDRGVRASIADLAESAASPLLLAISGGEALRRREIASTVARRLTDWRELAASLDAGTVEVDLDHLTVNSRRALREAIEPPPDRKTSSPASAELDLAFHEVVEAASRWVGDGGASRTPTVEEEADLHRRIAARFGGPGTLLESARLGFTPTDPLGSLRRAANRVEGLLPDSLRVRPAWLAAGAVAGALGCLAAATLATPLAISALPMWALTGGGLGGLLSTLRGRAPSTDPTGREVDLGPAVSAAAMQAVLLAHQGLGEDRIGTALSSAFDSHEPPRLKTPQEVRAWLDGVGARLAAARTLESSP